MQQCSFMFWSHTFESEKPFFSIINLVEKYSDQLKSQYLKFIYDLGNVSYDGKSVIEQLRIRDHLSFWWMTLLVEKSNWAKTPQITNIIKLMAFELWLKDSDCTEVHIMSDNLELIEAVKMLCSEKKMKIFDLQSRDQHIYRALCPRVSILFNGLLWLIREVICTIPFIFLGYSNWKFSNPTYTFISYVSRVELDTRDVRKFNKSFWGPLPNYLIDKKIPTNWLYLPTRKRDIISIFKSLKKLNKNSDNLQNYISIYSFFNLSVLYAVIRDFVNISGKHLKIKQALRPTCGIYWPLIDKDISRSLLGKEMVSALFILSLFERAALSSPKQKKIFYLAENQPWELALIKSFRDEECELTAFAHSTIRYWDLRYFNDARCYTNEKSNAFPRPDCLALNGVNDKSLMIKFGYPSEAIENVESLRYLYLNDISRSANSSENSRKTLLVLGDFLKADTVFMLSFLKLTEVKECLSKFNVLIKPHPACPLSQKDIKGIDAKVEYSDLGELILQADIVYTGNSSAAVEAYCLGKSIISARNSEGLNMSPLRGIKNVNFVSDAKSFNSSLFKCLEDNQPMDDINLFQLNPKIPKWRQLLDI